MLLHEATQSRVLYVSVDNPIVAPITLTELAEEAFAQGYEGLIFDEVHHAKDWSLHAKSIYDAFPNKKIWISDSSSLILRKGVADLSRRFPKLYLPFLSFREYLYLKSSIRLQTLDPFKSDLKSFNEALKSCNVLAAFKDYKSEGFRPIFLEGDYSEKIRGIIEKSIYNDIPFFVPRIQDNHLRLMNAVIGFLAGSPIPTLNIDKLATQWSLGKEKIYQLLDVMEHVGLINIVRYQSDHRASGKGAKIFLADPSMYAALSGNIGNVRESFVVTAFRQMRRSIYACKDERKGDFLLDKLIIEVGGKDKEHKGANFVLRDDLDFPGNRVIPLWSIGMMY